MFGRKKGPDQPFSHSSDCKIFKADPSVKIEWSEIRPGVWEAVCVCGRQHFHEPVVDDRAKLDPLDPATMQHGPGCPYREATEIPLGILKVDERHGYWWVECNACQFAWQTPFYAPESVAAGS
jgi:hypothetical protein